MTDYRHCDGPECDEKRTLAEHALDTWLIVERRAIIFGAQSELHFHNDKCLSKWAQEQTKRV